MLDIIKKLLETGIILDNWKYSMVKPIEKIAKTKGCEVRISSNKSLKHSKILLKRL